MKVLGRFVASGTASGKVVFTSIKDDSFGGDTNGDGLSSSAAAGDWMRISFLQNQATSTLTHSTVRYGGERPTVNDPFEGALRIKDASIEIRNSTIEHNDTVGIWMRHSTSTLIADSIIQEHRDSTSETFYGLFLTASSTPTIGNTTFRLNESHIFYDSTSTTTDSGGNVFE